MKIEVEKIQRLRVEPGETLVVTLPEHTTPERARELLKVLEEKTPEGVRVLVVTSGVELTVIAALGESEKSSEEQLIAEAITKATANPGRVVEIGGSE